MSAVSYLPVSRRSLPSPYASMCCWCLAPSFLMALSITARPPALRIFSVEKLVWQPAPFQSPGMGFGSSVTCTPKSSHTRCEQSSEGGEASPRVSDTECCVGAQVQRWERCAMRLRDTRQGGSCHRGMVGWWGRRGMAWERTLRM
jgi:hypothetical protein